MSDNHEFPAFLAARLNELETQAKIDLSEASTWLKWWPEFILTDIAAKRAILADYDDELQRPNSVQPTGSANGLLIAIENLCRPFADHPDWPGETP